jgi:hypothetical protein
VESLDEMAAGPELVAGHHVPVRGEVRIATPLPLDRRRDRPDPRAESADVGRELVKRGNWVVRGEYRTNRRELNYAVYHDRYRRTRDGWKFTERSYEIRYLDTAPLTGSAPRSTRHERVTKHAGTTSTCIQAGDVP